ncbi:MAG: hypothetical protein ACOYEG_01980 [Petrimonas sp.]
MEAISEFEMGFRSELSSNVLYQRKPLDSRATCYWKVKTRTNMGTSDRFAQDC